MLFVLFVITLFISNFKKYVYFELYCNYFLNIVLMLCNELFIKRIDRRKVNALVFFYVSSTYFLKLIKILRYWKNWKESIDYSVWNLTKFTKLHPLFRNRICLWLLLHRFSFCAIYFSKYIGKCALMSY